MLNKLTKNKKVLIIVVILLLLIIGIVIVALVNEGSKSLDGKRTTAESEQNKDSGLEIQEDDGIMEDSSDVSGSWEDTPSNDTTSEDVTSNSNTSTDNVSNDSVSNDSVSEEQDSNEDESSENVGNKEEPDEDTLIDDKTWGNIY